MQVVVGEMLDIDFLFCLMIKWYESNIFFSRFVIFFLVVYGIKFGLLNVQ